MYSDLSRNFYAFWENPENKLAPAMGTALGMDVYAITYPRTDGTEVQRQVIRDDARGTAREGKAIGKNMGWMPLYNPLQVDGTPLSATPRNPGNTSLKQATAPVQLHRLGLWRRPLAWAAVVRNSNKQLRNGLCGLEALGLHDAQLL